MKDDFEVYPRGTLISYLEEIRLSRELAKQIEQTTSQWGQVIPHEVMLAYNRLTKHYEQQIERGIQ